MRTRIVQGVGVRISCLDWKSPSVREKIIEEAEGFYEEVQPNGITAYIDFANTGDDNGCYLISYNYKPYEQVPFNSIEELRDFYVRALKNHVNNTVQEIRDAVGDIAETYFG